MSNLIYRDWAKQFYLSTKNYTDTKGIKQSKEIWNRILVSYPRLSEFWAGTHDLRELTSIERSFIEYIIQSELQKPYIHPYYPEMEYTWPNWEFPYPECEEIIEDCDPSTPDPEDIIFDAESSSCWCPGISMPLEITGTWPIYKLTITEADCGGGMFGTYLRIVGGWGTNKVWGYIHACSTEEGFITIEASMNTDEGVPGDSNVNLFRCDTCCEELICDPANPTTVAAGNNVQLEWTGGSGFYHVEVSGTGAWLDSGYTITAQDITGTAARIYADGTACGALNLTITDNGKCADELDPITCWVKCTTGVQTTYNNTCDCATAGDDPICDESFQSVAVVTNIVNINCTIRDAWVYSATCLSGGCGCTHPSAWCAAMSDGGTCLVPSPPVYGGWGFYYQCAALGHDLYTTGDDDCLSSGIYACWNDCVPPQAGKSKNTRCIDHSGTYPTTTRWEC